MAGAFEKRIKDLSTDNREAITDGIAAIAALVPERYALLANFVPRTAAAPHGHHDLELSRELGVSQENAAKMLLAAVVLATAVVTLGESKPLDVLLKEEIIEASAVPNLEKFLQELTQRQKGIEQTVFEQRLAEEVLPAFHDVDLAVDMRFGFEGDEIVRQVPVAIVYLTTDARDERLWFQISKPQLIGLVKTLQEAIKKLEHAEDLLTSLQEKKKS